MNNDRSSRPSDVQAGRSVFITGTSSGIGAACAEDLHARGYRVFAGVRKVEDADELVARTSAAVTPIIMDVTDQHSIDRAAEQVSETCASEGIAGLINNAGFSLACPLEFVPLAEFRRQLEVNLVGQLAVIQALLPLLRTARGRIVNISSISGLVAGPYVGPYAISKHALEALSDSLRVELRHFGIKVVVIEPGDIKTPIWEKSRAFADRLRDEMLETVSARLPEHVQECYRQDIAAMRAATAGFEQKAIPVERVVQTVARALESSSPRSRYRVGIKTAGAKLLRLLPDGLRDKIVIKNLGMR